MRIRMNLVIVSGLLAVLLLPGVAGAAGGSDKKQKTSFNYTGPLPEISAPFCDAEQHCLFPATRTATFSGDWVGSGIAVGGAATSVTGQFGGGVTWLFSGTIEGCGTGTLVLIVQETGDLGGENNAGLTAEGSFAILAGFGTGDLAGVTGRGTGSADSIEEGADVKGTIRCG